MRLADRIERLEAQEPDEMIHVTRFIVEMDGSIAATLERSTGKWMQRTPDGAWQEHEGFPL